MLCNHCPYDESILTGVPSCALPHCIKSVDVLAHRYAELYGIHRTPLENAEYRMLRQELRRKRK
jgi:hypothetical protein